MFSTNIGLGCNFRASKGVVRIEEESERGRAILSESSEADLVARARTGEMAAFEAIVTRYEPKLVRFIYGLTRERELAEDLCQETFLSAYRALPQAPTDLKLSAWLYKIALNKVRSEKRRKRPVSWFGLSMGRRDGGTEDDLPQLDFPDPASDTAENVARREAILQIMQQLPPDQAAAILMDVQGYNDEEIAVALETSTGAVRQKLFRGRKAFRNLYQRDS